MTNDAFTASRQALELAEARYDELRALVDGFFEERPYRTRVSPHDELAGYTIFRFKLVKPVPRKIRRLARKTARAMRHALDQIGPSATAALGGRATRAMRRFPFSSSPTAFEDVMVRRFGDAPAQVVDLFRRCRPYPGGDDELYSLDRVCRLPRGSFLEPGAHARTTLAVEEQIHSHRAVLEAPQWNPATREVTILHKDPDVLFKGKVEVEFYLAFGGLPELRGYSALAVLQEHYRKVENIVSQAALCVGSPADQADVADDALPSGKHG